MHSQERLLVIIIIIIMKLANKNEIQNKKLNTDNGLY